MKTMTCHCGKEYKAKDSDLARGWAQSCSKSCAAIKREKNNNNPEKKENPLPKYEDIEMHCLDAFDKEDCSKDKITYSNFRNGFYAAVNRISQKLI